MDPSFIAGVVAEVLARISAPSAPSQVPLVPPLPPCSGTTERSPSVLPAGALRSGQSLDPSPRSVSDRGSQSDVSSTSSHPTLCGGSSGYVGGSSSSSSDSACSGEDDNIILSRSKDLSNTDISAFSLDELIRVVVQEGMDSDGVLEIACSSSTKKVIENDLPSLLKVRLVEPSIWAELSKSPKDKALVLERIQHLKVIVPFANAILGIVNSLGDPRALHDSVRSALAYAAVSVSLANRDLANVTCDSFGVPRDNPSDVPFFSKNSILKAIKKRQSADIIANALKASKPRFKGRPRYSAKSKEEEDSSSVASSSSSSSRGGDPGHASEARGLKGKKKSSKK